MKIIRLNPGDKFGDLTILGPAPASPKYPKQHMYSSYLIKNTNETLDGFLQEECEAGFENFLALHAKEINRIKDICMPGSAGLAHFQ